MRDEPSEQSREIVRQWATRKIERLEAELADLRASSVVYKVRCGTCGGDGWLDVPDSWGGEAQDPCPDCDNGWQLAKGVIPLGKGRDWYVIPARLIEGDTDEG